MSTRPETCAAPAPCSRRRGCRHGGALGAAQRHAQRRHGLLGQRGTRSPQHRQDHAAAAAVGRRVGPGALGRRGRGPWARWAAAPSRRGAPARRCPRARSAAPPAVPTGCEMSLSASTHPPTCGDDDQHRRWRSAPRGWAGQRARRASSGVHPWLSPSSRRLLPTYLGAFGLLTAGGRGVVCDRRRRRGHRSRASPPGAVTWTGAFGLAACFLWCSTLLLLGDVLCASAWAAWALCSPGSPARPPSAAAFGTVAVRALVRAQRGGLRRGQRRRRRGGARRGVVRAGCRRNARRNAVAATTGRTTFALTCRTCLNLRLAGGTRSRPSAAAPCRAGSG